MNRSTRTRTLAALLTGAATITLLAGPPAIAASAPGPKVVSIPTGVSAPLLHAHSHNDYADVDESAIYPEALQEALAEKVNSVEADVWLYNGQVILGHGDPVPTDSSGKPNTLQRLYLDPLLSRVNANGGQVYPGWHTPLDLVIELKGECTSTALSSCSGNPDDGNDALYNTVHAMLENQYSSMLSLYDHDTVTEGAVKVIFTGNTPVDCVNHRTCVTQHDPRHEFFDFDFSSGNSAKFSQYSAAANPVVTANWIQFYNPADGLTNYGLMESYARTAHANGRQLRIYGMCDGSIDRDKGCPLETASEWQNELDAQVDFLNGDLAPTVDNGSTTNISGASKISDFLASADQDYGWIATPGAGTFAKLTEGTTSTVSGTLYDTLADGVCAHVAVTFYAVGGAADPTYRTYVCGATAQADWSVNSVHAAGTYEYAQVDVYRDNGPVVSRLFTPPPEGYSASANSACSTSTRIGDTTSIYDSAGNYYGWAEWRFGTATDCWGDQWALLHVTAPITLAQSQLTVRLDKQVLPLGGLAWTQAFLGGGGSVGVGDYSGTVLFAPGYVSLPICGTLQSSALTTVNGVTSTHPLFFGHQGQQSAWCA
ncbi:hypothetical protein [Actinocrinis sp.]|uniref:hypothetical protein n=1 Tax=Actinocrinis sp. TaxID=1920516 RepID=UPI002D4690E2|nr:hypothetical protein [Actinocrinis sp.]HZP50717.1 hypothetical protein [Actinocrinis sp.]